jgi:hypothetical protein
MNVEYMLYKQILPILPILELVSKSLEVGSAISALGGP